MKSLNVSPSLRLQPAAQHCAATDGMKILVVVQKLSELHRSAAIVRDVELSVKVARGLQGFEIRA